ncbi:hypothetical protein HYW40_02575 [Candidatus Curtissbacteria bacterium]|nr:hypothetical protein [Candidatus Curtissbacteria bacterium]
MNSDLQVKNIFAAVYDKRHLDKLAVILKYYKVNVLGTAGTARYLKAKGVAAKNVVNGFDFDERVKSLDKAVFARILADRTNKKHLFALSVIASTSTSLSVNSAKQSNTKIASSSLDELGTPRNDKGKVDPFDAVIVDLYKPEKKGFPESMDIGGQALIRAACKNYQNVAVAFDAKSIKDLQWELKKNKGATTLVFRQKQAAKALKFIAQRTALESKLFR